MDVDAVLHTSSQLVQTLQPLKGVSDKTNLLLEDVAALSKLLQRVRNTTFDSELGPMYDPMWETLQAADQKITEVVTEFERRVITIRAEISEHLRAVGDITGVTLDGEDRLEDGDGGLSHSRMADAQFDAEVVAWESGPKEAMDHLGTREVDADRRADGGIVSATDTSGKMSRYFPSENETFKLSHPEELRAIRVFFSDPSRREVAIVTDSWSPVVSFLFHSEGGCGKTELARHYCHLHKDDYAFIAWINASDASTVLTSYKKCMAFVKRNHREYFERNFPISEAQALVYDAPLLTSVIVEFVTRWLETLVAPWLMIVDNMGSASEQLELIHSGSGHESDAPRPFAETKKSCMQMLSLSYFVPRKCAQRVMGHVLVTAKQDQRPQWLEILSCKWFSTDSSAVLPFTATLSVDSIEQLFCSLLLDNEMMKPTVGVRDTFVDNGEWARHRALLESDIIARGMDLVNKLHSNPLAIVQALAALREVRLAFRLSRPKLQAGSDVDPAVPRQLALQSPPTISDYLNWLDTFSDSALSSFNRMPDFEASYKVVLTTIAIVIDKIPSIRSWSMKRCLEALAFWSPSSIDMGLLQLFLRPPHTPLHVRVLGKWRLPNTGMIFSVMVRLQEAEFEFEVESVYPLTLLNKTKRFKLRVFRNYAKIREAHDTISKLYCPAAVKLRFPSAILSVPTDGNAEDAVSVRRAELSTFFKDLSRCPCWGALCMTSAMHNLLGILPNSAAGLVSKVGTDSLFYSCDPLKVYLDCNSEFLRLASPLVSLSLLSVTHSEQLVPTEDAVPTRNVLTDSFGFGEKSCQEKYSRRLECAMSRCTQVALRMWLTVEGRYEDALNNTISFLLNLLQDSRTSLETTRPFLANKSQYKPINGNDLFASDEVRAICEAEYIDNSILPHALYVILEVPSETAEFISLARECFKRSVQIPCLFDKAELCCQRCLEIINKRGDSAIDGVGSILEAAWFVNYADIMYMTSRQDKSRALYEHSLKMYRKAPIGQQDVVAILSILKKLGKVYFEDARYKQAERILEESIDLSRALNAQDPEQLAIDLCNYATVMSSAASDLPSIQHCLAIKKEELELIKTVFGEKSADFARCANSIGELEKRAGRNSAAKEWFETSLDILVSFSNGSHPDMVAALYNMALLIHAEGELDRAQKMYERALAVDALHHGENHLGAANIHDSLGILLCDQGNYDNGLDHLRAACDLNESFCGTSSRDTILSLNSLGYAYMKMNETNLGINVYEKSLAALRQRDSRSLLILNVSFACTNPDIDCLFYYRADDDVTAQTLNALGEANVALGRFTEARQLFMECYGLRITALGDKHPDTANVMKNLATVAFANKSFTEAREMALGALKIFRAAHGSDSIHESIIPVLSDLGEIYHKLGKPAEANGYFEDALRARRLLRSKNGELKLSMLLINYGKSLFESSSFVESSRKYSEALEILRGLFSDGNAVIADCMLEYAEVKRTMGLVDDAQELIEECLAMRHSLFGEHSEPVAAALMQLCEIRKQQKDLATALDAGEQCVRIRAQLYGMTDNVLVASSLQIVAKITLLMGKGEEALAIYRDVLAMLEAFFSGFGQLSDAELSKKLSKTGELRSVGIRMTAVMHQTASILAEKECFIEATGLFERCLDLRRRMYGEEHGEVASTLHCIADISYKRGLFDEALEIHSIGHAIREQSLGHEDVLTAASDCYVAISELALGRAEKARDIIETSVYRLRNRFGDNSVYVAIALHFMSKAFFGMKDYESTIIVEEKALDILLDVEGRESGHVVDSLCSIGDAYRAQNCAGAAKKQYTKALEILKLLDRQASTSKQTISLPSSSRWRGGVRDVSSRSTISLRPVCRVEGFSPLSLEFCKGGDDLTCVSGVLESSHKSVGRIMALYERMLWALDTLQSPVEADAFAEEALDMYVASFGINSAQMVPLLRMLGLRQRSKGDYVGASPFLEKALWIQEATTAAWIDQVIDDEAERRHRCLFIDDIILNINDISWLLDKQGLGSDAASARSKTTKYNRLLTALRPSGRSGAVSAGSIESPASLFTYATSEMMSQNSKPTDISGGSFSLLSNLSLYLSNKTE